MVVMSTVASFAATLQAGGIECDSMGCDSTGCKGVLPPTLQAGTKACNNKGCDYKEVSQHTSKRCEYGTGTVFHTI